MCIIIYCPENVSIKKSYLQNAFYNNPDGGGVMYYKKDVVKYHKGFMDFDSFWKFWNSLSQKEPRALHFRIATSGKVGAGCCHPFPISDDLESMTVPQGIARKGCLMHNGVFSEYTPKEGILSPYSDTMYYCKDLIYPILPVIHNSSVIKLLNKMDSRVLLFLPNKKVLRLGDWEADKAGFYASNLSYTYKETYYESKNSKLSYGLTTYDDCKSYNEYDYYEDFDWFYYLQIKAANEADAINQIDSLIMDIGCFVSDTSEPYDTLERLGDGHYGFSLETYGDVETMLPKSFAIINESVYDPYSKETFDVTRADDKSKWARRTRGGY